MSKTIQRSALCALTAIMFVAPAEAAVGEKALSSMPVREITVFKDGHAFVLHEGDVATDEAGNVHLDYLPTPVIGTFWPYSADAKVKLDSVAAGRHRVGLERTALSIRDLLEANIGSTIRIREARLVDGKMENAIYNCTILSIPKRSADELEASAPAGNGPQLAEPGQIILLRSEEGTRAVPIATIQDVTFLDNPTAQVAYEEIRNLLRLKMNWGDEKPKKTVKVGLTYLQRGIRWIPQYRLTLNGDGTVKVQLQATLLNELTDLKDVRANLLVGVPTFDFKDTVDPISLQQSVAQLSQYFEGDSQMSNSFSNGLMTQQAFRMTERPRTNPQGNTVDLGPNVAGSGQNESMFMFTIRGITLAKGERMVLPVGEWTMKYEDVYRLEIPIRPPAEVRGNFNTDQQQRIAEMMKTPKAKACYPDYEFRKNAPDNGTGSDRFGKRNPRPGHDDVHGTRGRSGHRGHNGRQRRRGTHGERTETNGECPQVRRLRLRSDRHGREDSPHELQDRTDQGGSRPNNAGPGERSRSGRPHLSPGSLAG